MEILLRNFYEENTAEEFMNIQDTIAAPATANGKASIGIIRISGSDALKTVQGIFEPKNKEVRLADSKRRLVYGHIVDKGEVVDEVLISYMKAPHTFTCEDIVEINCHGGMKAVEKIMSLVITKGARAAQRGEFTKRAFLNGRIDLSQAESVMDIISAKSTKSYETAQKQLAGNLSRRIDSVYEKIEMSLAKITVAIDFPDEIDEEVTKNELVNELSDTISQIENIKSTYKNGKIIKDGINVAIVGKPNVGKSSLLNELLEENRAIVTDIAGTTRDVITESLDIDGITVNIMDTAGIRDTSDSVEKIGVQRSMESIKNADMVLFMVDSSSEITKDDEELYEKIKDKPYVVIVNKSDLKKRFDLEELLDDSHGEETSESNIIHVSVKNKIGMDDIKKRIYWEATSYETNDNTDSVIITNARHYALLQKSIASLSDAKDAIISGEPFEIFETDYYDALSELGEITGKSVTENLLDTVFENFCIGK